MLIGTILSQPSFPFLITGHINSQTEECISAYITSECGSDTLFYVYPGIRDVATIDDEGYFEFQINVICTLFYGSKARLCFYDTCITSSICTTFYMYPDLFYPYQNIGLIKLMNYSIQEDILDISQPKINDGYYDILGNKITDINRSGLYFHMINNKVHKLVIVR